MQFQRKNLESTQFQQSYNLNELANYSLFILISTQSFTIFCKHNQTQFSLFKQHKAPKMLQSFNF